MVKFLVTEEDMKRYDIFKKVKDKQLKLVQASKILNLSYRHTLRLFEKFKLFGLHGLIKKYNNKFKNRKIDDLIEKNIVNLYRRVYYDFNIKHFTEKLNERHNISLSDETIRLLLIKNKVHIAKKRKKLYRRRRRMPKAGLMVQMDSSLHQWIKTVNRKWYLIATIDDATNEVAVACFYPHDSTYNNMNVIRSLIEKKGLFEALYVDKASHFITTRHRGLHQELKDKQDETNIQKALLDLNITMINANSAQAKGRIERLFRFFQDRLINEMRLEGIKDYQQANEFLQNKFLPWYNKRYTRKAKSAYKLLPKDKNLDFIFTKRETRKVRKDNTITFKKGFVQLPPSKATLSYTKPHVEIRFNDQQDFYIVYKNKIIFKTKMNQNLGESNSEKREKYLSRRIIS